MSEICYSVAMKRPLTMTRDGEEMTFARDAYSRETAATNTYSANSLNQYALVGRVVPNAPPYTVAPTYDMDGNVIRYLDVGGNTVAQYTYDAFGKHISKSGPLADFFRHRFSTKYFDVETELYYYGYRFYHPGLMRWLNRDPLEEDGGINLYEFVDNSTISIFDPIGESPYVKGEQEPPRRTVLAAGTWNTLTAPSGTWKIRVRAKLTVLGGSLRSMPDASRHLQHFLDNTGTPLDVRFREMNRESRLAREHLERELRDALLYAERIATADGSFVMVTPSETGSRNETGNWLFAVGQYTTWARASVVKCGNSFSMNWHFYFRDIYDWELNNGLRGGLVSDHEMALLHRYGIAREYEMNGRQFIHAEWEKGQRAASGARIIGL